MTTVGNSVGRAMSPISHKGEHMRKVLAVVAVVGLVLSPVVAGAATGNGTGTNGNNGNGVSGSTGNQGGGNGQGDAGGGHGGSNGGGNGGSNGGNGGHGAGSNAGGGAGAAGSSVSGGPAGSGPDGGGTQTAEGRGQGNHAALRACTGPETGFAGLVDYRIKADGTFTYWGVEYALPTFVQCMKDKGVQMSTAGRNELTNFGTR